MLIPANCKPGSERSFGGVSLRIGCPGVILIHGVVDALALSMIQAGAVLRTPKPSPGLSKGLLVLSTIFPRQLTILSTG